MPPHIKRNQRAADDLLDQALEADDARHLRAEGVHVSDLIYCPLRGWGRLHGLAVRVPARDDRRNAAKMFLGQGHHAFLQVLPGAEKSVVVPLLDGQSAYGTIDLTQPVDVGEIKTTRYSMKKPMIDLNTYVEQVASYCLAEHTLECRVYIAFINGDYAKDREPLFTAFDLTFEPWELAAWQHRLTGSFRMVTGVRPPDPRGEHYSYECSSCLLSVLHKGNCKGHEHKKDDLRQPFFADLGADLADELIELEGD